MNQSQTLKILYISNPNSIHTQRWINWFAKQGHNITLIGDTPLQTDWSNINVIDLTRRFNYRVIRFVYWAFWVRRLISQIKPDILHAHRVSSAGWLGAFTGFHPFVVSPWGSDLYQHPYRSRIAAWLAGSVLRRADMVVASSQDLCNQAIRFGAKPETTHRIGWGVDLNLFKPGDSLILREEYGIGNAPVVLSIRGVKPIYNLDVIIKSIPPVIAAFPDTIFCFQRYNTDPCYLASLEHLIQELGVSQNVRWIGEQHDWRAVAEIYRLATLAVSLATTDSMPISLLEVMATGAPIIASDLPSIREWITDGVNGFLIPPRDEKALAHAIIHLLENPDLRHEFSQFNRRLVLERADHQAEMSKMENLYYGLLKGK